MSTRNTRRRRPITAPDEGRMASDDSSPTPGRARPGDDSDTGEPTGLQRSWVSKLGSVLKLVSGVLIVVGVSSAVAWGAYRYALTTPRFAIRELEITGNRRLSERHITRQAKIEQGANIFALDTEQAERSLLDNPWIRSVKLTRQLPGTLTIEIAERQPVAIAAIDDQLLLMTKTGEPFKAIREGDPFDLPVITGISARNLARDRARELERIRMALNVLRNYERLPLSRVHAAQEVHLTPEGHTVLTIGESGVTLQLGRGPWRKKLLMAARVMGRLQNKGQVPGIVFLDNQAHPERVVVRMR